MVTNSRRAKKEIITNSTIRPTSPNKQAPLTTSTIIHHALMRAFKLSMVAMDSPSDMRSFNIIPTVLATASTATIEEKIHSICDVTFMVPSPWLGLFQESYRKVLGEPG